MGGGEGKLVTLSTGSVAIIGKQLSWLGGSSCGSWGGQLRQRVGVGVSCMGSPRVYQGSPGPGGHAGK